MKMLEEIQRGKLMSAYGGVGSMVETRENGSLMIMPFEEWPVYHKHIICNSGSPDTQGQELMISEPRLKKRLIDAGFTQLEDLFTLPELEDVSKEAHAPSGATLGRTVASEYFPRWFYCPLCRKFQPIEEWEREWNVVNGYNFKKNIPACHDCSTKLQKDKKKKNLFVYLEQTRFVLASMDGGEVIDVPWGDLFNMISKGGTALTYPSPITTTGITFNTSTFTDNLYGLYVTRVSEKQKVSLSEIDRKYFVKDGHAYKMVPRNANNVYFPYVMSSIYIPKPKLSDKIVDEMRKYIDNGLNVTTVANLMEIQHPGLLTEEKISTLIRNNYDSSSIEGKYNTEEDFRDEEFDYITHGENYKNNVCSSSDFMSIRMDGIKFPPKIVGMYCLKKLKETKVLIAYSRIDSVPSSELNKDFGTPDNPKTWYNVTSGEEEKCVSVRIHPISTHEKHRVNYMPAIENIGEGFFVELDLSAVPDEAVKEGLDQNKREVFLHTYCHLIMKELEFQCGYPLASLSERLYYLPNKGNGKFGFMIYTIGGEAGSYGGITSLFSNGAGKILQIINNAIIRAKDCPNDPICEYSGGHCFACLDVPETTCELFNKKLNRNIFNNNIPPM